MEDKEKTMQDAMKFCQMTKEQALREYKTSPNILRLLIKTEKKKWLKTIAGGEQGIGFRGQPND